MLPFWEAIRPMWPFLTYFVILLTWPYVSPNDIMEKDPRAIFMLSGTIFSNVSVSPSNNIMGVHTNINFKV